jgi:hypothetical protein
MDKHSYLLERKEKLQFLHDALDRADDLILSDEDEDLYEAIEAIATEIISRIMSIKKEVRQIESADSRMDSDLHSRSA